MIRHCMGNLFNKNVVTQIKSGDSNFSDTLHYRGANFMSGYKVVACSTPTSESLDSTIIIKRDNWIIDIDVLDEI